MRILLTLLILLPAPAALAQTITLSASPSTLPGGETVQVSWTASSSRPPTDWIGLYRSGDGHASFLSWSYIAGGTFGVIPMAVPARPGTYEFRYFLNNSYDLRATSNTVTVTDPWRPLTAAPADTVPKTVITVSWNHAAGAPVGPNDWIGMFGPYTGTNWAGYLEGKNTGGARSGSVTFTLRARPGTYTFRYFTGTDESSQRAASNPVIARSQMTVTGTPGRVAPGRTVRAYFTAPPGQPANDWIGFHRVGADLKDSVGSRETNGATSGFFDFIAPSTPGEYEFRYNEPGHVFTYAASGKIIVDSAYAGFSLNATPATVDPDSNITVRFNAPAGRPTRDWIALYRLGDPNTAYGLGWSYTGGAQSGTLTFKSPSLPGDYEFRYLLNDGYEDVAVSSVVSVSYARFSITSAPGDADPGQAITGAWSVPEGRPSNDWVGFYRAGAPDSDFLAYQYTNGTATGTMTVVAPSLAGNFEFRYFLNNTFARAAVSTQTTVHEYSLTPSATQVAAGSSLTLRFTARRNRPATDWLALYKTDEPNAGRLVWWTYTNGVTSGSVTISAPQESGSYEFRYLLNNTHEVAVRSVGIHVGVGTYSLTPGATSVPPASPISVSWNAPPGRPATDWIGIFRPGDPNTAYTAWKYTGGASTGTLTLPSPGAPGTYEFRYLLNNGYSDVARSAPFTVQ